MGFKIVSLIFLALSLVFDFKRDKGKHLKPKIAHTIALIYLVYTFSGSFGYLGWLIGHFDKFQGKFNVEIGIIPANIHFVAMLLHVGLSLILVWQVYKMIKRDDLARKRFLNILLLISPTEIISFYRGFQADGPFFNDYLVLLLGAIIIGLINLGLVFLYTRPFMKAFFWEVAVSEGSPQLAD